MGSLYQRVRDKIPQRKSAVFSTLVAVSSWKDIWDNSLVTACSWPPRTCPQSSRVQKYNEKRGISVSPQKCRNNWSSSLDARQIIFFLYFTGQTLTSSPVLFSSVNNSSRTGARSRPALLKKLRSHFFKQVSLLVSPNPANNLKLLVLTGASLTSLEMHW